MHVVFFRILKLFFITGFLLQYLGNWYRINGPLVNFTIFNTSNKNKAGDINSPWNLLFSSVSSLLFLFLFLPCPSLFISSTISSLPFLGRPHKMTHKGWHVIKPQQSKTSSFALYVEDYFMDSFNEILGILVLCDTTIDIIINVGHLDLYCMVQWFCLISWMLFDIWTSLFEIMNTCDPTVDLKVNEGHCELYFKVLWFYVTSWRQLDVWLS